MQVCISSGAVGTLKRYSNTIAALMFNMKPETFQVSNHESRPFAPLPGQSKRCVRWLSRSKNPGPTARRATTEMFCKKGQRICARKPKKPCFFLNTNIVKVCKSDDLPKIMDKDLNLVLQI